MNELPKVIGHIDIVNIPSKKNNYSICGHCSRRVHDTEPMFPHNLLTDPIGWCIDCLDEEEQEAWEILGANDTVESNIFDGTPDWLRME